MESPYQIIANLTETIIQQDTDLRECDYEINQLMIIISEQMKHIVKLKEQFQDMKEIDDMHG